MLERQDNRGFARIEDRIYLFLSLKDRDSRVNLAVMPLPPRLDTIRT
jgi:hypothetical protein